MLDFHCPSVMRNLNLKFENEELDYIIFKVKIGIQQFSKYLKRKRVAGF